MSVFNETLENSFSWGIHMAHGFQLQILEIETIAGGFIIICILLLYIHFIKKHKKRVKFLKDARHFGRVLIRLKRF